MSSWELAGPKFSIIEEKCGNSLSSSTLIFYEVDEYENGCNCANIALTENIIKCDDITIGSDTTAEHIVHLCSSIHPFGIWTCFH